MNSTDIHISAFWVGLLVSMLVWSFCFSRYDARECVAYLKDKGGNVHVVKGWKGSL